MAARISGTLRRMLRWLGTSVLAALSALWVVSIAPAESDGGHPQASRALAVVISAEFDPARADALFPADFADVIGYRPVTASGPEGTPILLNPDGDCSSPIGPTTYDFTQVCAEHDLAYDLLRYAGRVGEPLPLEARQAADMMFAAELHARCDQLALAGPEYGWCHTLAQSFAVAVEVNSWRQGYWPPEPESSWTLTVAMTTAAAVFCAALLHTRFRRQGPHSRWLAPPPMSIAVSTWLAISALQEAATRGRGAPRGRRPPVSAIG